MMRRIFIVALLQLSFSTAYCQDILPEFDKLKSIIVKDSSLSQALISIKSEELVKSNKVEDVPARLINFFSQWNNEVFRLSKPNEPYNATDEIDDQLLPTRRLINVFQNDHITIIHYEHGGIGHHKHIVWSEYKEGKIIDIWTSSTFDKLNSVDEVISFLKTFSRVIELKDGRKITNYYVEF